MRLAEWMGSAFNHALYGAGSPERRPSSHPGLAPYGSYKVADGAILLGIQNDREWAVFCSRVLGDAALATDPRFVDNPARVRNRAVLDDLVNAAMAALPADGAERELRDAGIACGRVRDAAEAAAHPQFEARGRWQAVATPAGPIQGLAAPWLLDSATLPMGKVPALGEHTDAILAELGYAGEEAAGLRGGLAA